MTRNIVHKSVAPTPPYPIELCDIPTSIIPSVLGGIWLHTQKYFWVDGTNAVAGKSALAAFGARILMPSSIDITNRLEAIYNLVDDTLNGTVRTFTGDGTFESPYVYTPPIPQVVDYDAPFGPTVKDTALDTHDAVVNFVTGAPTGAYTDARDPNDQFQGIIDAIEATGGSDADMLTALLEIVTLLGV